MYPERNHPKAKWSELLKGKTNEEIKKISTAILKSWNKRGEKLAQTKNKNNENKNKKEKHELCKIKNHEKEK